MHRPSLPSAGGPVCYKEPPMSPAALPRGDGFDDPVELTEAGTTVYHVTDPVSGLVEREWNHLFVGYALQTPDPDPLEVEDWANVPLDELVGMGPDRAFTAWFPTVLDAVLPSLGDLSAQCQRR